MDRPPQSAPPAAPQQRQEPANRPPIPPSLLTLDRIRLGRGPRKPGYVVPKPQQTGWSPAPSRRRNLVSWISLVAILVVQVCLTLRLDNGAFRDEALLISAGHAQLDGVAWTGDAPSGAPQLYPTLAALADNIGGLSFVRALSMLFMLGSTALVYSYSRRLFNERAGLCAASLYVVTQSTAVLGHLATFDALSVLLLAAAIWIVVKTGRDHFWAGLAAAPVIGFAVAVKYASAPYMLPVVALAILVAIPHKGRPQAIMRGVVLLGGSIASTVVLLGATGAFGAFQDTTTSREKGTQSALQLLSNSTEWAGLVLATAVIGAIFYVRRSRMGEISARPTAPEPGRNWRIALAVVLCSASLMAPLYQAYLQTGTSLYKHIGLGLLFTSAMAGVGITRLVGAHFKFPQLGIMVGVLVMIFGQAQATYNFGEWSDQRDLVASVKPSVKPQGRFLSNSPETPAYYLRDVSKREQWYGTEDFAATIGTKKLAGAAGLKSAIQAGWFNVIILDHRVEIAERKTITAAADGSKLYRKGSLAYMSSGGPDFYEVWLKN